MRDCGEHQVRVSDRAEGDKEHPVFKPVEQVHGELQSEAGLADASRAGDCDQEDIFAEHDALQRVQLLHTPDYGRARRG